MFVRLLSPFVLVFLLSLPAQAANLPALHRGVNHACWLANVHNRQVFYQRDFDRIHREGFDFVRLPYNPEFFGFSFAGDTDQMTKMNLVPLDQALASITQAGLAVVLDIHPFPQTVKDLKMTKMRKII